MESTFRARSSLRALAIVAWALLSGCAALDSTPSRSARDALRAHAWTLPACPSEPGQLATRLLAPVVGAATDLLLDRVASALTAAATADREGVAWSGSDARYLYFGHIAGEAVGGIPTPSLTGCVVIALTDRASSQPAAWCAAHDAAPAASPAFNVPCTPEGRRLLAAATRDVPQAEAAGGGALPRLYAEIRLRASRDGAAIVPQALNLHYPAPLQPRASATRDLAFTLQLRLPGEAKGANLFVLLRDLAPGKPRYEPDTDLAQNDSLWTAVPAYSGRKLTPADAGEGLAPVNIVTDIRETGDTNAFLQALAAGFGRARPALGMALE
jgi:hypothetical protein